MSNNQRILRRITTIKTSLPMGDHLKEKNKM